MGLGALDELQQQRPQVVDLVDDPVRPGVLVGGLEIRLLELAERLGECRQQLLGMPDTVLAFGLDGGGLPPVGRTRVGTAVGDSSEVTTRHLRDRGDRRRVGPRRRRRRPRRCRPA